MPAAILPAARPDELRRAQVAARLLRQAARAQSEPNQWRLPPLKAALPWTAGEAVAMAGLVRESGGNWYVSVTAATCGATAPSHTHGSPLTDGGVLWTYLGPAECSVDDPLAPVVTALASAPAGYGNEFRVYASGTFSAPAKFALRGGYLSSTGSSAGSASVLTLNTTPQGSALHRGTKASWAFVTDEPSFTLAFNFRYSPIQLVIDGRRVFPDGILGGGTGGHFLKVDCPGGRRSRHVQLFYDTAAPPMEFAGVRLPGTGMVWAPDDPEAVRALFLSDSIWAGSSYGPFLRGGAVSQRVAAGLGWADPWDFSLGGTGYVNPGTTCTFGQRVPEALLRKPDIWMLMGSTNDNGQSAAAITAAALATFRAIRAGSAAPIVVFGVWPTTAQAAVTEAAVKAAFDTFADPLAFFIPVAAAKDGVPWVSGSWNNTGFSSSVNGGLVLSGDGTHPADVGTAYLARRIEQAVRQVVLPAL